MLKTKAVLFGLNYATDSSAKLSGCINDVKNMAAFLQTQCGVPCEVLTDESNPRDTTLLGMLAKLYDVAAQSHREGLDFVWIHYSGHGSYIADRTSDERDGRDEALVPSDFRASGLLCDDYIQRVFRCFNPNTQVVFVFDCCHSGTIGDVKYSWEGPTSCSVENITCQTTARVVTISGCLDTQTSADAYDVLQDSQYVGAMTACMLLSLKEDKIRYMSNLFALVTDVRAKLRAKGFTQVPKLCSSYNLALQPGLLLA